MMPEYNSNIEEWEAVLPDGRRVYGQTQSQCQDSYNNALRVYYAHESKNATSDEMFAALDAQDVAGREAANDENSYRYGG